VVLNSITEIFIQKIIELPLPWHWQAAAASLVILVATVAAAVPPTDAAGAGALAPPPLEVNLPFASRGCFWGSNSLMRPD
jgi:hypothetical protein